MRLFVAIALPAGAAGELDNAVAPLRLAWPEQVAYRVDCQIGQSSDVEID